MEAMVCCTWYKQPRQVTHPKCSTRVLAPDRMSKTATGSSSAAACGRSVRPAWWPAVCCTWATRSAVWMAEKHYRSRSGFMPVATCRLLCCCSTVNVSTQTLVLDAEER